MGFEVFDKRAVVQDEPLVTIQKGGFISMNRAAFEALGSPKSVELLYDSVKKTVGLRTVGGRTPHAYPVRANTKGSNHVVTGALFAKHYGIDVTAARRWRAEMRAGILCIDIGKPPVAYPEGPRGRKTVS